VRSITQVAHAAGKETIAEFAESGTIIECLREMGVDYAQGYGVGFPEPISTSFPLPEFDDVAGA
jgi:EAL domain-containing protein (putative c-di-GMP-specific phosphodiesterase class I)